MSLVHLLHGRDSKTSARRRSQTFRPGVQPILESLESRTVLSTSGVVAPLVVPAEVSTQATTQVLPLTISRFNLTSITTDATGRVVATGTAVGTFLGHAFTTDFLITTEPSNADCPILHLELGEIHLDLLGLNVDTSRICLDITAQPGEGNLLGNLLCDVAHLLDGSPATGGLLLRLNDVLNGKKLLSGLNDALNQVTSALTSQLLANPTVRASVVDLDPSTPLFCDILNLSLGPIELDLLGLVVALDNCEGGPVTVDITAEPGPGNLLGNLLCGLGGLFDDPLATLEQQQQALTDVLTLVRNA
jgi:hypothetical protein